MLNKIWSLSNKEIEALSRALEWAIQEETCAKFANSDSPDLVKESIEFIKVYKKLQRKLIRGLSIFKISRLR